MKLLNYMRYDNNDYKVVMQHIAFIIVNYVVTYSALQLTWAGLSIGLFSDYD